MADPWRSDLEHSLLLTDRYQLTMLAAYQAAGMTDAAVFEFFVRKLPPARGFLVAAGLAQLVEFLCQARFDASELGWLAAQGWSAAQVDQLARWRFTGDLDAVPEGTVMFGDEPILRVSAPIAEAQLIESRLINLIHFQTLIASKAARMVLAAPGKRLIDFGLRRAHGAEAGLLAARAAYLAGFAASATLLAERRFGVPSSGTMAHSFIQAHDHETEAFRHFASAHPGQVVLLIDTYDTERAAQKVVALAPELATRGIRLQGVRLDSGDLAAHARKVRRILDAGGLAEVQILASGGIDETLLLRHGRDQVPIDGYGIGTNLTTSADLPALDCAYKLQAYAGRPRRKRSEGKATWPGAKQVYRSYASDGAMTGDVVALADERHAGQPLLQPVLRAGHLVAPLPDLAASRAHAAAELARLPLALRRLDPAAAHPVRISARLQDLARALDAAGPD